MAQPFTSTYTRQQREACVSAYIDRGIRPMARIPAMAKAGELFHLGEPVPAFTVRYETMRNWIKKQQKERAKRTQSQLVTMPSDDANEQIRRRLLWVVDTELVRIEEQAKKAAIDPEHLRQIVRCAREIKALGGPSSKPVAPGRYENGQRAGGETEGGLAHSVLAAARRAPEQRANGSEAATEQERSAIQQATTEKARVSGSETASSANESGEHSGPGSRGSEPHRPRSPLLRGA